MQPYHQYITYPYLTNTTASMNYMTPVNYQQSAPVYLNQPYNHYGRMPLQYVPHQEAYPFPPISNSMPMMIQPQTHQPYIQQFQQPQAYFYNRNRFNGVRPGAPVNKNLKKNALRKNLIEPKNNAPDGKKNPLIKELTSNNDFSKSKSTKSRVAIINRTPKRNNGFQDSSDDEFERIPLDSPRIEAFKQSSLPPKRSTAQIQRIPSTASSYSHCSTCTNCSCSECRQKNGRHMYDDCPQCRAEWEREHAQTKRQKPK